ncbi:MAG: hypothetical protein DRN29_04705 [Thermoplasmata archaeon]|nr:MAG: hypothetical protein DRN29_04705 [Thermoplasmata archaeon]
MYVYVEVNKDHYEETIRRLKRHHNIVFHPRLHETIDSAIEHKHPNPRRKTKHLKGFPAIPYHNLINAQYIAISQVKAHEKTNPTDYSKLNFKYQLIAIHKTAQYKTVWFSKGNRRK